MSLWKWLSKELRRRMGMSELTHATVLVVRHGATSFNHPGDKERDRLKGTRYDLPLTDKGQEEAKSIGKRIAEDYKVASLQHSPMRRAQQTASHISQMTGIESKPLDGLDPLDVGFLSGWPREKAKGLLQYYISNPHKIIRDGQSFGEWYEEWERTLIAAMRKAERDKSGAHVLVSHSCNAANIPSILKGGEPEYYGPDSAPPASVARLRKMAGKWRMDTPYEGD